MDPRQIVGALIGELRAQAAEVVEPPPPPSIPRTVVYRSVDGTTYFRFAFRRRPDGSIRIYILEQPSYGHRETGPHDTHRIASRSHRVFICWDQMIRTMRVAYGIAQLWSEETLRYIRTGQAMRSRPPQRWGE